MPTGRCGRWPAGHPLPSKCRSTAVSRGGCGATRSRPPTPRPTAAGCCSRPTPPSTTDCSTSSPSPTCPSCAFCGCCPPCSAAPTCASPTSRSSGAAACGSAPTARSCSTPTAIRSRALPVEIEAVPAAVRVLVPRLMSLLGVKIAAARGVGALARRAGRGGGTSLPGKLLIRLEPHAIGELAGRLPRGQRGDLGHQRQDDHGGDDGRRARAGGHPPRAQPRRREHGRGRGLHAARRRPRAARHRRRVGPVRGRRVLARSRQRRARPARGAARQPVSRSARPLRRAGDDRRALGRRGRRRCPMPRDWFSTPTIR